MRKAFNFYRSYYDVFQELSDKDKLEFIKALLERQFHGVHPELKGMAKFAYISQKEVIDQQIKGWEDKTGKVLSYPTEGGAATPCQQEKEEEQEKEEGTAKAFVLWFNKAIKELKGSGNFKLTDKVKRQYNARVKDGYHPVDFLKAFNNASKNQFHTENNYQYLTPEFFTRSDILEKWCNAVPTKLEEEKGKGEGGVSMEELYNANN